MTDQRVSDGFRRWTPQVPPVALKTRAAPLLAALVFVELGAVSGLTAGSSYVYYSLLALGAGITAGSVLRALQAPERLNAYSFFRLAVMVGYILGPTVAVAYWIADPNIQVTVAVGPFAFHGYTASLSLALMTAYFAAALASALEGFCSTIGSRLEPQRVGRFQRRDLVFIAVIVGVVAAAIAIGDLGYMGAKSAQDHQITVLGGLAALALPAGITVFFYGLLNPNEPRKRRVAYGVFVVASLAALTLMGRRYLIFALLVALVGGGLARPSFRKTFRFSWLLGTPRRVILVALIFMIVLGGIYSFRALRFAEWQLGPSSPLTARITRSVYVLETGYAEFYAKTNVESRARPGTLPGYLGGLEEAGMGNGLGMGGRCLLYAALNSVPRLLFPAKEAVLSSYSCTDQSVNAYYGLPIRDSPATILTKGYADFGIVGSLTYFAVFASLFQFAFVIVRHSAQLGFRLFACAVLFNAAVFVEQDLTFYVVALRNLALLWLIAYLIARVFRLRSGIGSGHRPRVFAQGG